MHRLLIVLLFVTPPAFAEEVTPAHVFQAVSKLTGDIGLIRAVTGAPTLTAPAWIVNDAQPRHVFYQAQTLFRKANQLAVEIAGADRLAPPFAGETITPADVVGVVRASQAQIDIVKAEYGVQISADTPQLEPRREPKDVFVGILQASRQLNLLLQRRFRPQDVFERLVLASTYVAGVVPPDADVPAYGDLPPFEPAKSPSDVYRRVLECLQRTVLLAEKHGLPHLDVNLRNELRRRDIAPADVYDVVTTVLSELAFITLALDGREVEAPPVVQPKHVFPSHVYQVAGMLQEQLATLEES